MAVALAAEQRSPRVQGSIEWVGALALGVLLLALLVHVAGVVLDQVAAVRYPYELDYGEGVVWALAARIPGQGMYPADTSLPFLVYHWPPLYFLLTRMAGLFMPDLLAAGRLVSVLATLAIGPLVAGLVVTAGRPYGARLMARHLAIAAMAGLLAICVHAVRTTGLLMRVDMVAAALALAGLLVSVRANGRIGRTSVGLLLCTAAAFTDQAAVPAGIAVVVVTVLRKPRKGLIATAVAAAAGIAAAVALEVATGGGFLRHVLGDLLPRFTTRNLDFVLLAERQSAVVAVLGVIAGFVLLLSLWRQRAPGPRGAAVRQLRLILRLLDPTMAARAVLLLAAALETLMLLRLLQVGASLNALVPWLCMACVLIGVLLCDLLANRGRFVLLIGVLGLSVVAQPLRQLPRRADPAQIARQDELVRLVAEARKPVASEELTLLMRAGRHPVFEPAAVTELTAAGRWDEASLVRTIRERGFAFMITTDRIVGGSDRRSPAVDAAMRAAYPDVEQVGPGLYLNLPQ